MKRIGTFVPTGSYRRWLLAIVLVGPLSLAWAQRGPVDTFYLAKESLARQDWRQAAVLFEAVLQGRATAPHQEESLFWIAYCYQKLGEHEKARGRYAEYLDRYPSGRFAPVVRARLRSLLRAKATGTKRPPQRAVERTQTQVVSTGREEKTSAVPEELPLILSLLEDTADPSLRVVLITSLGELEDPSVISRLEAIALYGSSNRERVAAVRTLASLEHPSAIASLTDIARRVQEPEVARAIVPILLAAPTDPSPVLWEIARHNENIETKVLALTHLARCPTAHRLADSLYTLALSASAPTPVRREAIRALGKMTVSPESKRFWTAPRFLPLIRAVLDGSGLTAGDLVPLLSKADGDQWSQISPEILELGRRSGHEQLAPLLRLFQEKGLGKVPPQRFIEILREPEVSPSAAALTLDLLRHHRPEVVPQAFQAYLEGHPEPDGLETLIREVGPQERFALLQQVLSTPQPERRRAVVRALGALAPQSPEVVQLLVQLTEEDPDPLVQWEAYRQLKQLPYAPAQKAVRRLEEERYR
ncbi:MAG: HEAT repeat domain-containing protein [candidate division KSB1 bacterium]|nr:HEAT repeat domain-containing protein [candidate division KSB1 bacterium]